ncbi:hypothetical protein BU15DRAFT_21344, partial [Melanogaster broomeanus]
HSQPCSRAPAEETTRFTKVMGQKLDIVLDTLKSIDWTVADLLYYLFRLRDQDNDPIHRSHRHAAAVQQFLRGKTNIIPSFIVDAWLHSADG